VQCLLEEPRPLVHRVVSACRVSLSPTGSTLTTKARHGFRSICSALHRAAPRLLRPRLTPARPSRRPPERPGSGADMQVSWGKTRDLRPIYPSHLHPPALDDFGLPFVSLLRPSVGCLMRFVFLGPGFCLQLLSHETSRSRSCLRLGVPVIWASRGLTPPSHVPVGFRLPVASFGRLITATCQSSFRRAPCPAHETGRQRGRRSFC